MSNANESAYPVQTQSFPARDGDYTVHESSGGLTKREAFAMAAMQGFISAGSTGMPATERIVELAIETADAMLAALERTA